MKKSKINCKEATNLVKKVYKEKRTIIYNNYNLEDENERNICLNLIDMYLNKKYKNTTAITKDVSLVKKVKEIKLNTKSELEIICEDGSIINYDSNDFKKDKIKKLLDACEYNEKEIIKKNYKDFFVSQEITEDSPFKHIKISENKSFYEGFIEKQKQEFLDSIKNKKNLTYIGEIEAYNKGGLLVKVQGVQHFIKKNDIALLDNVEEEQVEENLKKMINKKVVVTPVKLDIVKNNFIMNIVSFNF